VGLQDPGERAALRDNILGWRGDGPHSNSDVSAEQYRSAGLDYGPRNGPFASAEELMLIPGMTPTIYRRLLPLVTTHSGEGNIDIRSASRLVLMSLPGVDPDAVDAYLAEREAAREQGLPIPEFPESGTGASDTGIYSVESVSRLPSGLEQGIRVSMRAERSPNLEPFRIVHYRLDQAF
jgi:general secretion pathway protein K